MCALRDLPGVVLRLSELRLLTGMPANRCRKEQGLRAAQRCDACAFRVPLIPAHQCTDVTRGRLQRLEPEVARREVKLLVVERIVRDVHLAIDIRDAAVLLQRDSCVVVDTGRTPLKQ